MTTFPLSILPFCKSFIWVLCIFSLFLSYIPFPYQRTSYRPKVQEPCSIRCSTSMGLIPSLQCRVCLCLYHPECVDGKEFAGSDEYVCKVGVLALYKYGILFEEI